MRAYATGKVHPILSDARLSHFLSRGNPGGVREQIDHGFVTGAVRNVED